MMNIISDVSYTSLDNIVNYEQPGPYIVKSTSYSDEYTTPVLTPGQTFILGHTNEMNGIYPASTDNPIILFDDFTGSFKWVDFPFKVKSSAVKILKSKNENTSLRYVYHVMCKINFHSNEHKRLWISNYSKLSIPYPPIEYQNQIASALDLFSSLTAELTAELTLRKKQYKFYRDKLLSFDRLTPEERESRSDTHVHL